MILVDLPARSLMFLTLIIRAFPKTISFGANTVQGWAKKCKPLVMNYIVTKIIPFNVRMDLTLGFKGQSSDAGAIVRHQPFH